MSEPTKQPEVEIAAEGSKVSASSPGASAPTQTQTEATGEPASTAAAAAAPAPAAEATGSAAPPTGEGMLPAQHWIQLAEDRDPDDDADSAVGDDNASSTASLSSSILQYRTIQGRTFHSEQGNAEYWTPNDAPQNEALDIIHHVLTLSLEGKLFMAPLKEEELQKVVDIGTGTGIWAIDFADEFPNAQVVGTDVSPIQPSWIPPNLEFQIDDCTRDWTFTENSVDYVHMRWLFGSIVDWPALMKEAYKALKPGGWVESQEATVFFESDDGSLLPQTAMAQFGKFFVEGGKKMGRSFTVVEEELQRKSIEEAGFVDIDEKNFKTPSGSWPKDPLQKQIGMFQQAAVLADTEGTIMYMAGLAGWSKEETQVYSAHLRRELRSPDIHAFYRQKIVWARKPLDA